MPSGGSFGNAQTKGDRDVRITLSADDVERIEGAGLQAAPITFVFDGKGEVVDCDPEGNHPAADPDALITLSEIAWDRR